MEFKVRTIGLTDSANENLKAAAKAMKLTKFEVLSILLESLDVGTTLSVDDRKANSKIAEYRDKKMEKRKIERELRAKIRTLSEKDVEKLLGK